jgi:FKBP-type peptidyl-prolyl cis-trans isomerase
MRERTTLVLVVFFVVHFAGCKRSDEQTGATPKAAPPPASAPATQAGATQAGATKATDTPTSTPAPSAGKTETAGKPAAASAAPLSTAIQPGGAAGAMVRTPSGLEYEVIQQGEGPSPPLGAKVTVHFAGFVDGKKFMDTHEGGAPREFKLDRSRLIDGWVEALLTMKKGEKRKLNVPSRLAYGRTGYPGLVPPGKDVTFDLELVSFLPPSVGP